MELPSWDHVCNIHLRVCFFWGGTVEPLVVLANVNMSSI